MFESGLTLRAQTKYWFYTADQRAEVWTDFQGSAEAMRDVYPNGEAYSIFFPDQMFLRLQSWKDVPGEDFNFELQGRSSS